MKLIRAKRTFDIHIRVTPTEKQKLEKKAYDAGLSLSEYIRQRLIHEQPDLMQVATQNYLKVLETRGIERGIIF
jgi:hypothetical protein